MESVLRLLYPFVEDNIIIPAQIPIILISSFKSIIACLRLLKSIILDITVDSPPGIINASHFDNSDLVFT